jgi:apolipoprotein N-acyltransferase
MSRKKMADTALPLFEARLSRFARWMASLKGARRLGVAVLCGGLACGALPPLYLIPLLLPAFTGLIWLVDGAAKARQAAALGWAFGLGYFLPGVYWVGIAFLVDAERFAWAMPFAILGLTALLALFPAVGLLLLHLCGFKGLARLLVLAAVWVFVEWLRSWVFSGFPWNLLGIVWSFSPAMLQLAAFTGVWGLSWVTVLTASAPALLAEPTGRPGGGRVRFLVVALLLLPLFMGVGGALRLAQAPAPGSRLQEDIRLRIVQPAIDQKLKWKRGLRGEHVMRQMRLTTEPGFADITHVIWSETAVPFFLSDDRDLRRTLARVVPAGGLLLTGAPRGFRDTSSPGPWNSFHALDPLGNIIATFDKFHLVPFGEYVPFRKILGWAKLTVGDSDFQPGSGPATLSLPGLPPLSPLICYEVIFPGAVTGSAGPSGARAQWLLNVTNDSWFGTSTGPYQHFANARMRAVEEGLPLVRAANSGISGVIDPYGRVIARLGLNEVGKLDSSLPKPIEGLTLFARIGNWSVLIFSLISGILTYFVRKTS